MIINESGGGAGLNLKVVGGTTQPTNPAENTVWVSTDTEITSYAFSATQPENPTEGMVWIIPGINTGAPMNIGKKNTLMLYPRSCSQYIGGTWVEKVAKTWLDGKWVDWLTYIYNKGTVNDVFTGGLIKYSGSSSSTDFNLNESTFTLGMNTAGKNAIVGTENKIKLSDYDYLVIKVTAVSGSGCPMFVTSLKQGDKDGYDANIANVRLNATGTFRLPVSNLQDAYVCIGAPLAAVFSITVSEWYLE